MSIQYSETKTVSWGGRLISSLLGVVFGIILFIGAFPLLWWNEGRSVDRIKTLDEGRSAVVTVSSDAIDNNNDGALIHFTGKANTSKILKDNIFGISENALKLKRQVEMFQWEETKETRTKNNTGGSQTRRTTYSYNKTWSEKHISSSDFKKSEDHQNPSDLPYETQNYASNDINVGEYKLTRKFIDQINNYKTYSLTQKHFAELNPQLQQTYKLVGNKFYKGTPKEPQIGDVRISYKIIKPTNISLVGKQNGSSLEAYFTDNGDIALLENGIVGAASMFSAAENENTLMTWFIRGGGFALMWFGLFIVLRPIKILADILPVLGSLVGASIGLITGLVALGASLSTIALAWLFFRPLLACVLFIAVGGLIFLGYKLFKKPKKEQAVPASQPTFHQKQSSTQAAPAVVRTNNGPSQNRIDAMLTRNRR